MRKVFAVILCMYSVACAAQPSYLLSRPFAVKVRFLDSLVRSTLYEKHPDTVVKLEKWAREKRDAELSAIMQLEILQHVFKKQKSTGLYDKQLLDMALSAHNSKLALTEAAVLNILGDYWITRRNHVRAFEYQLASYRIYSQYTSKEFPFIESYLFSLSLSYNRFGDHENAFRMLMQAQKEANEQSIFINLIENAVGMYYRNAGRYDSADWYFRQIYERAMKTGERPWQGISLGNIGIGYFYQKRYEEAIPLLKKDIEISLSSRQVQNAIHSIGILATIYMDQHRIDSAEINLKRALDLGHNRDWWPNYKVSEEIFLLLSKLYAAKHNMQMAYLYGDSARVTHDSLDEEHDALSMAKASENSEMAQHQLELQRIENERKLQVFIRNGLIGGICMLSVIALLFINRQRLKHKKLEAEKKNAEYDLELANAQLTGFKLNIQEKNKLIEQFNNELANKGQSEGVNEEVLARLESAVLLTDEQWEEFRVLFEKVHKGFFKRVKEKMPDLTPAEVRFVALSKLKLNGKEMASMLGISANSIRNYRHRLRKKLDLSEDASFEEIADAV